MKSLHFLSKLIFTILLTLNVSGDLSAAASPSRIKAPCCDKAANPDCDCPNNICGRYTACIGSRRCFCEITEDGASRLEFISQSGLASCSSLNYSNSSGSRACQDIAAGNPVISNIQEACDFAGDAVKRNLTNANNGLTNWPCEGGPDCSPGHDLDTDCEPVLPAPTGPNQDDEWGVIYTIEKNGKCCTAAGSFACKKV